ncbi:DNA-binding GntR family transcriptional regulator [Kitasatospora sp. GP30]|nr:DNA-binding GntR family transcriptional regulator [Kitasatospora sp. GP30]
MAGDRVVWPLRRRGIPRLAESQWGAGASIWAADIGDRDLEVDRVDVSVMPARPEIAALLGESVLIRRRRFVLDRKPVLLSDSHFPAALVAGTRITEPDTGPGGSYARLAEVGGKPVRFREEIRSRMPSAEEAAALELAAGTPVVLVCRTAFSADGRAVEVNEMVLDAGAYVLEYEFEA